MNKIVKVIILETFVLVVLLMLLLFLPKSRLQDNRGFSILLGQKNISKVCFREPTLNEQSESKGCFQVEIADTILEQQKGLMFRESLDRDGGMLFVFEKEGNYPFWMKNTLIPLDMIWINQNQEVVFIEENAQPCQEICTEINPNQNAKYVLEVNGGLSSEINLKIGDKISFE